MLRRLFLSICLVVLSTNAIPTWAATVTINNLVYNIDTSKLTAEVRSPLSGMSYSGSITIPSNVTYQGKNYPVVRIADYCFLQTDVQTVTIPTSVTTIGKNAFSSCSKLERITLPNSVATLGESIFFSSSISEITLSTSLKTIPKNTFALCTNLTHIELPNSVTTIGDYAFSKSGLSSITFSLSLTSIGDYAFNYCKSLDNVVLPNSVRTLGKASFYGCSSLSNITFSTSLSTIPQDAFLGCQKLTEIDLCEGIKTVRTSAFYNCSSLRKVTLSSTVNSIEPGAFFSCRALERFEVAENNNSLCSEDGVLYSKSMYKLWIFPPAKECSKISLPESVQEIADMAFYEVASLYSIEQAPNLRRIGNRAFAFSELCYINLPTCLTEIGDAAFMGCSLGTLVIPSGVTKLGSYLFSEGAYVSKLLLLCKINDSSTALGELMKECVIYTPNPQVDIVKSLFEGEVYPIGTWPEVIDVISYIKGVEFRLNPDAEEKPEEVLFYGNGAPITPDADGMYRFYDLNMNTKYEIKGLFFTDYTGYYQSLGTVQTLRPTVSGSLIKATETTLTFKVSAMSDKTCQPTEYGIYCNGNYYVADKDSIVCADGLNPGKNYSVSAYARYGDVYISSSLSAYTQAISLWVTQTELTPTTFACTGSYKTEETRIATSGFQKQESDGQHLRLTGLIPNKQYTVTFFVHTTNGGQYTKDYTFTTPKVSIDTQNTKVVSQGTAIVCAKTNLGDDDSAEVGFEWRKLEAPDIIPSKTGTAILYEGTMEGIIRNLDPTAFYKVRPYFIDTAENTYYGDWTGFDPNEFSYFEPTVHTYANVQIGQGQATLRGYALSGTDDLIEQGFEYWRLRQATSSAHRAPEDGRIVVKASGQRMEAVITGLDDNTVYGFRAYAKTATKTIYGEEIEFTTPIADGISQTEADTRSAVVLPGIFTLSGQFISTDSSSLNNRPRGIYIVDGRKVVIR